MKKLQQFDIYAFKFDRLKNNDFKIKITPFEAELNEELIALADNEMLRAIRRLTKHRWEDGGEQRLSDLFSLRKKLTKQANSDENRKKIKEINNEIRNLLFIPEIISVTTPKKRNYPKIGRDGFWVNGVHYRRFMCSAGQARTNRALFCADYVFDKLEKLLSLGLNDVEIIPAKWNAYFSLTSSATYQVTEPRCVIIPDKEVVMNKTVDWVEDDDFQDKIVRCNKDLTINLWDGQGLISPEMAKRWSDDIGLDYVSSQFCVRAPFCKGMLCVIDFHKFADEIAHTKIIKDIYGVEHDVDNIDVILSQSQFKLWNCFNSFEEYIAKMKENGISWGVSKFAPSISDEKQMYRSNYQFLQVLNLNDDDIVELCSDSVNWIKGLSGDNYTYLLLFMLGSIIKKHSCTEVFDFCNNSIIKSIMLEPNLVADGYIQDIITRAIRKKIKEFYLGKLILHGNFQCLVSDPYGQMQHAFGIEPTGLLKEGEAFSDYWNRIGVKQIASQRAPLTWKSEVNVFSLVNNPNTQKWFNHITSGIVYNIYGVEAMLNGGADFDYDLVATTNNKCIINGKFK